MLGGGVQIQTGGCTEASQLCTLRCSVLEFSTRFGTGGTNRKGGSHSGLARRGEVQLAYAIGVARPVSLLVETFGTGTLPDEQLSKLVEKTFDARPGSLIEELDLRRPIFRKTGAGSGSVRMRRTKSLARARVAKWSPPERFTSGRSASPSDTLSVLVPGPQFW